MAAPPPETGRAPVNGLQLYYEIHGAGEPLVLLHGGLGGIAMMAPLLPLLAARRRVIALDLQGHGHTPDIARPLRFERLADDVAGLLAHLGIAAADLVGFSLGGGAALRCAIQHPDAVRRLVLISAPFRRNGWYPEVLEAMAQMGPAAAETVRQGPLRQIYPDVDWAALLTKQWDLLGRDYDWSQEVAGLAAPTLLVFADADSVRTAHALEFFALLGGGQRDAGLDGSARPAARLAVLPGSTHYDILFSPLLAPAVLAFLEAPAPGAG